jgi:hypothetical protein
MLGRGAPARRGVRSSGKEELVGLVGLVGNSDILGLLRKQLARYIVRIYVKVGRG